MTVDSRPTWLGQRVCSNDRIGTELPRIAIARILPIWLDMSRTGTIGDALIEILDLCEQTLAAFDSEEPTRETELRPDRALVPVSQQHKKDRRGFSLIKGGQYHRPQLAVPH